MQGHRNGAGIFIIPGDQTCMSCIYGEVHMTMTAREIIVRASAGRGRGRANNRTCGLTYLLTVSESPMTVRECFGLVMATVLR